MKFRHRLQAAYQMLFDEHRQKFLTGEPMGGSGGSSLTGVDVSGQTAMAFSGFFSGVQQISQTVASLPFPVYQRVGEGRDRLRSHPLYPLLNLRTNQWVTSFIWRETMQHHAIIWGNAYSFIQRDRRMNLVGFVLMNPEKIAPKEKDGRIVYEFRRQDGTVVMFEKSEIFHLPGLGFDGIRGYSLLTLARESLGVGLAMQQFTSRFYGSGTQVGAVLERPKESPALSPEAATRLVKDVSIAHSGLGTAFSVMLLEEGTQYKPVGMPLKDAEFLGSRQFSIQDIARFLNMPPHKLKELSKATFSNIEHEQLSYVTDTIRPWLVRWEALVNADMISPEDQERGVFAEHIVDALLRGDVKSSSEALAIERQNGIINANEWRKIKNRNEIEGEAGEAYLVNGNMIRTERAGVEPETAEPGAPDETTDLRAEMDTYGIAVRSGSITPQQADEIHFRAQAGLPPLSPEVVAAWEKDEGTRRPITLVPTAEATAPEPVEPETAEPEPPEEDPDEVV